MFYFYRLEPEVAGGLGEQTVLDTTQHPPIVKTLEYCFDGWLGDELLESFPCFIVSEALMKSIHENNLSGCRFVDVIVTYSQSFIELYGARTIPKFFWLKINGESRISDFGIDNNELIVSHKALNIIKNYVNHCGITEF